MLTISSSTISGNYAKAGGGIGNVYYSVTLSNSTIIGNSAYVLDGGINNTDLGTLHTRNTIVAGNMAPSSPDLQGNPGALGGGLDVYLATLYLRSSLVAGNRAFTGPDLNGLAASADHNLLGDGSGSGGVTDGQDGNQVGTAGSPIEPRLGPLQDNGGLTPTMALLPGSPAIDAGDNTDAPCWDQRREGFPRIVGIIDPDNPVIDIGAFEVQDAGGSQGRSSRLGLRPVSFAAAALVGMQSLPPMSHSPRAAKPLEGAVDALFATNNTATRPAVTVGRPAVTDPFSPFHKHEESRQDLTQDDVFDWFGRLFL